MTGCHCGRFPPPWVWLVIALALVALVKCADGVEGEGVPQWLVAGLAARETRSFYLEGRPVYIDRRDGRDGEVGMFQCTPAAFADVAKKGERFARMRWDSDFAETIALRYLVLLRKRYRQPDTDLGWLQVARHYNAGDNPTLAHGYAADVWAMGQAAVTPR